MYRIMKQNDQTMTYVLEYVADRESDIEDLPTDVDAGSVCIVIETAEVYMLNNEKKWIKL